MNILGIGLALLVNRVLSNPSTELISQASNEFSNRLYSELASEPGNLLVCPLSLHMALELVHQGAGGRTAQELTNVLRLDGANDNVREGYKDILTGLQGNVLKMVTKLYPKVGYQLKSAYTNNAKQYFLSEIEAINYSDPVDAANTINKYVEDHTNNKIHDLINADFIMDFTRLIIANAVHLKDTWKTSFDFIYDDFFKVSTSEEVPVKMMAMTSIFDYKIDVDLQAQILKMEYKGDDYSMILILPMKENGLPALETKLANTSIASILNELKPAKVTVKMPKFQIEKSMHLRDVLNKMGVHDLFTYDANLQNIANGDLYVSDVIQKNLITVHENGTEASAATAGILMTRNPPMQFRAQHPFHFILLNNHLKSIIFRGRLSYPE